MSPRRSNRYSGRAWGAFLVFFVLALGGAGAAYFYLLGGPIADGLGEAPRTGSPAAPDVASRVAPSSDPLPVRTQPAAPARTELAAPAAPEAPTPPPVESPVIERGPLPDLAESDAPWRASVAPALAHPLALEVQNRPDLIRTFVTATLEIGEGRTPNKRFDYLAPKKSFDVLGDLLYTRPDPASYSRYDALVDAFMSLDSRLLLQSYERFEPLFDRAYSELGYVGEDFDEAIDRAITELLETPVLSKSPALIPRARTFAYEDPGLENLSPAKRQLMRMGPENVRRVKAKLSELQQLRSSRR